MIQETYKTSLALLTDLYQLTMAYGYWKQGRSEDEAVFNLFFRTNPFKGNYTVTAGLEYVVEFINAFKFSDDDIAYLKTLCGNDDSPLFDEAFLDYLREMKFTCDIDAIPEGELVFPNEPLIRVQGPLIQCQLLETAMLNIMNFQTLIATKASRLFNAAAGEPILEFGLRRAQGIDGALTASRAAYIGGCSASSNVLAGRLFGIPVKGTHAHSWVMSFDSELESFRSYAEAMPNNCLLLVDTYDTIQGVKNAVIIGKELKKKGKHLAGIRLDSGDMTTLSIKAREILDNAGFHDAAIVASNDLNEYSIADMKRNGSKISVWGVGTKLVTAYDQPALGGVYKLAAIRKKDGEWQDKIKLSEDTIKMTNPGIQQIYRFYENGKIIGDVIDDVRNENSTEITARYGELWKTFKIDNETEKLLVPVYRNGNCCYTLPELSEIRNRTLRSLEKMPADMRKTAAAAPYFIGLSKKIYERKIELQRNAFPKETL